MLSAAQDMQGGHGRDTHGLAGGDTLGVTVILRLFGHKATAVLHSPTSISAVAQGVSHLGQKPCATFCCDTPLGVGWVNAVLLEHFPLGQGWGWRRGWGQGLALSPLLQSHPR